MDEAEGLAVDSSSSVCSGAGGGGRLETTTDQQLSLLNSITASDLTGQFHDLLLLLYRNTLSRGVEILQIYNVVLRFSSDYYVIVRLLDKHNIVLIMLVILVINAIQVGFRV